MSDLFNFKYHLELDRVVDYLMTDLFNCELLNDLYNSIYHSELIIVVEMTDLFNC